MTPRPHGDRRASSEASLRREVGKNREGGQLADECENADTPKRIVEHFEEPRGRRGQPPSWRLRGNRQAFPPRSTYHVSVPL